MYLSHGMNLSHGQEISLHHYLMYFVDGLSFEEICELVKFRREGVVLWEEYKRLDRNELISKIKELSREIDERIINVIEGG